MTVITPFTLAEGDVILYDELCRYGERYDLAILEVGREPVKIEVVIGKVYNDALQHYDLWIKASNGYAFVEKYHSTVLEPTFPQKQGQRLILEITPYRDGSFGEDQVLSYEVIEEGVDYKTIEEEYKASHYEVVPFKQLLRSIDDYKGKRVCIEGLYFQDIEEELGEHIALLMDDETNPYCLTFGDRIQVEYKILLDDRIRVYGLIAPNESTYEYISLRGKRTVPRISVEFVDLLEDE